VMGLGFLTDAKILWVVKNIYLDQNKSCGLMSATQKVCAYKVTKGWIHVRRKMITAQQNLLNGTGFFKICSGTFCGEKTYIWAKIKVMDGYCTYKKCTNTETKMWVTCLLHVCHMWM
jgi:hypothetical protein